MAVLAREVCRCSCGSFQKPGPQYGTQMVEVLILSGYPLESPPDLLETVMCWIILWHALAPQYLFGSLRVRARHSFLLRLLTKTGLL